jgi:glycosyltransferase involved in cell wall biosynthesis
MKFQFEKERICVVSFPLPSIEVTNIFLTSLIEILRPLSYKLVIISSNIPVISDEVIQIKDLKTTMHFRKKIKPLWFSTLMQIFKIIIIEIKICWYVIKFSNYYDSIIFYVGGAYFLLPIILAKLMRKKVITSAIGLPSSSYGKYGAKNKLQKFLIMILKRIENINFFLSGKIIIESKSAVNFLNLGRYNQKIVSGGARYINTELFTVKNKLQDRGCKIGYLGRLDYSKGVMDLFEAFCLIQEENLKMEICGEGPLMDKLSEEVVKRNIKNNVQISGWIPHDKVVDKLNEFALLILPSYSEGLPTIILEAMACGTPVLVTPVGGIPDLIQDSETGFIIEKINKEEIAKDIERVLNYSDLETIVRNARNLIINDYNYESTLKRFKYILSS